jgi:hypothetical protein
VIFPSLSVTMEVEENMRTDLLCPGRWRLLEFYSDVYEQRLEVVPSLSLVEFSMDMCPLHKFFWSSAALGTVSPIILLRWRISYRHLLSWPKGGSPYSS